MVERSGDRARGRASRDLWLATTAMATGFAIYGGMSTPAFADCAATGSIISCSGTTASPGYGDGTQTGQTITVVMIGDKHGHQMRYGGHISGLKINNLQFGVAGGYVVDRKRGNGAYSSIDMRATF